MKNIYFILFFALVLGVWSGMHFFVYFRMSRLLDIGTRGRLYLKVFLILMAVTLLLGRIIASHLHSYIMMEISYYWLAVIPLLFFLLVVVLPVNLAVPRWNTATAFTVLGLTALITVAGMINYARGYIIRQVTLTTPSRVSFSNPVRIVQISDLHMSGNTPIVWVRGMIDDTLAQNPDLIVITGDILDEELPKNNSLIKEFSRLKAPFGVFAVSGNHELYNGIQHVERFLQAAGITFLRNERCDLGNELSLYGFDDEEFSRMDKSLRGRQLELLNQLDPNRYNVLLYHRPTGFEEHARKGIHLQLSGHTHAGQTVPLNLIVFSIFRYPCGLYHFGSSAIYTSRGTGVWGPPVRFPLRSELTVFDIRPTSL